MREINRSRAVLQFKYHRDTRNNTKMGNSLRGNKTTKVMKIDGETMKLKTPVKAGDVLKDHPGLVLLDSESVKHYGVRAKALEAHKGLEPKRLYFLVEPPRRTAPPRRIRSGINMSAKDRLENLMLARRSTSDLSIMKKQNSSDDDAMAKEESENGKVKLKLKLPKKEVEKLIRESKDETDAAQRIMALYMAATSASSSTTTSASTTTTTTNTGSGSGSRDSENESEESGELIEQKVHLKKLQKRVSFKPITHQAGREIAVAS